jgi:hypothetical protein
VLAEVVDQGRVIEMNEHFWGESRYWLEMERTRRQVRPTLLDFRALAVSERGTDFRISGPRRIGARW